jgi:hypothetical protein
VNGLNAEALADSSRSGRLAPDMRVRPAAFHRHACWVAGLLLVQATSHAGTVVDVQAMFPEHPRLFLTEAAAATLRLQAASPGHHREAFRLLLDRVAVGEAGYDGRSGYRRSALAREAALAFRITQDPAYARLAYATLVASRASDEDQPDAGYGLSRAMMCLGYAITYDWCWQGWDASQRTEILDILRAAADAWPAFRHANVDAPHRGSNWVGVTRGAEFVLHLAARGDGTYGDRTDRLQRCADDLSQHLRTAYGPSGWTQEGLGYLHYTFGFLGPAALASRDTAWSDLFEQFRRIPWHRLAWHAHAFRAGQRMLQSGVGAERIYNEGFASLVFATTPSDDLGAYRSFYDRHVGIRSQAGDAARDTRFDGQRAGSLWALLLYPDTPEVAIEDGPLIDEVKGAYYFRNRWQDRDDILVSLMMRNDHHGHAWSQPETFGLAIMGFDTTFAAGPGKERGPEHFSKLLIDGITPPSLLPGARLISAYGDDTRGGTVIVDGAANLGLTLAQRRFTVDFSGRTGCAGLIEIEDHLAAATAFAATFQIRPGEGVVLSQGTDGGLPWFLMRRGEGWMKGWSTGATPGVLETSTHVRLRTADARAHHLHIVLALGTGEPPTAAPLPEGAPGMRLAGVDFVPTRQLRDPTASGELVLPTLRELGAALDGRTNDAAALQQAIDNAHAAGGGTVTLPAGCTALTGSILLKSGVTLHLAPGSRLLASADPADYHEGILLGAKGADNIAITGPGTIDGQGRAFMARELPHIFVPDAWRPRLMLLEACTRVRLEGFRVLDSPRWTVHLAGCDDVLIDGLTILNNPRIPNCDGINPDHSRNVRISNCHIEAGDDCIVIKCTPEFAAYGPSEHITITNCTLRSTSAALKCGTETVDDIRHVTVSNCTIRSSHRGIALVLRDRGNIEDIVMHNVTIETLLYHPDWWGAAEPIYLSTSRRDPGIPTGQIRRVSIAQVRAIGEGGVFIDSSLPGGIEDVTLRDVSIVLRKSPNWPAGRIDVRPPDARGTSTATLAAFHVVGANRTSLLDCAVTWQEPPQAKGIAIRQNQVHELRIEGFREQ